MFQLFELILSSPIGGFIASMARDTIYAAMIVAECEECAFDDLGKLLFGGFAVALVVGIGGSLLWRRRREKDSRSSGFVSIRSIDPK